MIRRPPRSTQDRTLFPYTTLFRSVVRAVERELEAVGVARLGEQLLRAADVVRPGLVELLGMPVHAGGHHQAGWDRQAAHGHALDRLAVHGHVQGPPYSDVLEIGRASCREECTVLCRSRWSPYHSKKKKKRKSVRFGWSYVGWCLILKKKQ